MRVAFILEHYAPHVGGAEKLFSDLARALCARGVEVRVLTSTSGGLTGVTREGGAEIHHYRWPAVFGHPVPRRRDLATHVRWADIVQTSQYTAAPGAVRAARRAGRPCLFVAHELLADRWRLVESPARARVFQMFEQWVFSQPYDRLVAVSRATARDLVAAGRDPDRVVTIHPVFDDFAYWRERAQSDGTGDTFLYYGRPGKTKGVFLLLDAIRQLHPELNARWRFELILSDDPLREKRACVSFVRREGLGGRVRISDSLPQDALRTRLQQAYCVIVPSLTEGFGFSAYQAACLGRPIISSDAGSLPEVVSGSCILFQSGRSESLRQAILRATRGDFDQRPDQVARDGAARMLALYESLLA